MVQGCVGCLVAREHNKWHSAISPASAEHSASYFGITKAPDMSRSILRGYDLFLVAFGGLMAYQPWIKHHTGVEAGANESLFADSATAVITMHVILSWVIVSQATTFWPIRSLYMVLLASNRHIIFLAQHSMASYALGIMLGTCIIILAFQTLTSYFLAVWNLEKFQKFVIPPRCFTLAISATTAITMLLKSDLLFTSEAPSKDDFSFLQLSGQYFRQCSMAWLLASFWSFIYSCSLEPQHFLVTVRKELQLIGRIKNIDRIYEAWVRFQGVCDDNKEGFILTVILFSVIFLSILIEGNAAQEAAILANPWLRWQQQLEAAEEALQVHGRAHTAVQLLPEWAGWSLETTERFCRAKVLAFTFVNAYDALLACSACVQYPTKWNATCARATELFNFDDSLKALDAAEDACRACRYMQKNYEFENVGLGNQTANTWLRHINRAIFAQNRTLAKSCCQHSESGLSQDWVHQAESLGQLELYEDAVEILERGLQQVTVNASTKPWLLLGRFRALMGQWAGAELALRRGIRLDAYDPDLRIHAAFIASSRGRLEDAEESFLLAYQIYLGRSENSKAAETYTDLCHAYLAHIVYPKAATCAIPDPQAAKFAPASLFNHQGIAKAHLGLEEEAAERFIYSVQRSWSLLLSSSSLYKTKSHADAFNNLGSLAWSAQRFSDALKYFEMALEVDPNHDQAKTNLKSLREASTPPPII